MAKNPPGSKWNATPRALRHRKSLSITISDDARTLVELLAHHGATVAPAALSTVVEALIWAEAERLGYRRIAPQAFKRRDAGE